MMVIYQNVVCHLNSNLIRRSNFFPTFFDVLPKNISNGIFLFSLLVVWIYNKSFYIFLSFFINEYLGLKYNRNIIFLRYRS